jgi:tetratricopeptide (TPR) repeat protein
MKQDTLCAVAVSSLVWLAAFPTIAVDKTEDKTDFAVFNICRVEQHVEVPEGRQHITIESGMGDGGFSVATTSHSAQQWFNYGIKLYHAFYHGDAKQAFDKAVAADPHCSMCLWAQALSRGPTMNFDVSDDDLKSGLEFARQAQASAHTEREKILTAAIVKRYSRAQDVAAERDFASEVLRAEAAGPPTLDLRLLAAEVLMTAWRRGDHTTASAAVELIEPILRANPENTAAIHYYIHATEYAGKPILALSYAEKLAGLAPKASHLVHMAAHTYFHIGRYEDATVINASALKVDAEHLTDTATPGLPAQTDYYEHNLRVGMAGALMSGDRTLALKFADHVHKAYPRWGNAKDGLSDVEGQRFVIYARYDPASMLLQPEPSSENPQTRSLYHYARGEAFAALHDAAGLSREIPQVTGDGPVVTVAKGVLAGRLAMLEGHFADAARAFESTAAQQDTILASSMDPPSWWYPIRRSAAAALLLDGQFASAADMAQASLAGWPADPLALLVLSRAEDRLGRTADARHAEAAAIGNWEGDIAKVDIAVL